jgi:hypothetical protein
MNSQNNFKSRQEAEEQERLAAQQQQQSQQVALEFNSVEEMLRHDALHTAVPPALGKRLAESISQLPASRPLSWWRRLLGGR